jgi:aconitate hydratase
LKVEGTETFDVTGIAGDRLKPRMELSVTMTRASGETVTFPTRCRIDTVDELEYYRHGGILQYVLRSLMAA